MNTYYVSVDNRTLAIQRGNAVCDNRSSGLEGFFDFQVHEAEFITFSQP